MRPILHRRAAAWILLGLLTVAAPLAGQQSPPPPASRAPDPDPQASARGWIGEHLEELVQVYRDFHSHPELSLQEQETAARLARHWRDAGLEVTGKVGGHGVVGVLRNGDGPVVMLRTDLDALPVTERTGLVYSSMVRAHDDQGNEVDVMHACGHDVHMTNLVAVARYLAQHRDGWRGTLLFVGQPAEERVMGAKAMLDDGLFNGERFPRPTVAIALHCDSTLAAGRVSVRGGAMLANVDGVDITVKGKGGHGAAPETTIDPVVQAAQLVLALQTIVSREVKPSEPAVITVGSIHGGTKHNIISDHCHLQLTVRSYSDEVRQQLLEAIERKARGMAIVAGAEPPEVKVTEGTPATINDDELARRLFGRFQRELGVEQVEPGEPVMGAEDFSLYGRAGVPIVMYRLGTIEQKRLDRIKELGQTPPSLHSPFFYPDIEPTLTTAVVSMVAAVRELAQ